MNGPAFDLAAFCASVGATPKESNVLRQDLVRGLKDYFEAIYGYDRYGAETGLLIADRMAAPRVYGYGVVRILHDRRVSSEVKIKAAARALDVIEYGADGGLPYGLLATLHHLWKHDRLDAVDLRYGLVVTAGENAPFHPMQKPDVIDFMERLLAGDAMSPVERAFWTHSLVSRNGDAAGTAETINLLMSCSAIPLEVRRELCTAWVNFRQPRLDVSPPTMPAGLRQSFITEHMPFWVAHAPSWPTHTMVRMGLVWLARLGGDPMSLARQYLPYRAAYSDQIHAAVAEIIWEHRDDIPQGPLQQLIEEGIGMTGSIPTRRRFYRLGTDLFGPQYLERASSDTANSVRQWASRELQKQD